MRHLPRWQQRGLAVLASRPEETLRHFGRHAAPFPLIRDPHRHLFRMYGVTPSWAGFLRAWTRHFPMIWEVVVRQGLLPDPLATDRIEAFLDRCV